MYYVTQDPGKQIRHNMRIRTSTLPYLHVLCESRGSRTKGRATQWALLPSLLRINHGCRRARDIRAIFRAVLLPDLFKKSWTSKIRFVIKVWIGADKNALFILVRYLVFSTLVDICSAASRNNVQPRFQPQGYILISCRIFVVFFYSKLPGE